MTRKTHPPIYGEIPKGRAELVLSLCAYDRVGRGA